MTEEHHEEVTQEQRDKVLNFLRAKFVEKDAEIEAYLNSSEEFPPYGDEVWSYRSIPGQEYRQDVQNDADLMAYGRRKFSKAAYLINEREKIIVKILMFIRNIIEDSDDVNTQFCYIMRGLVSTEDRAALDERIELFIRMFVDDFEPESLVEFIGKEHVVGIIQGRPVKYAGEIGDVLTTTAQPFGVPLGLNDAADMVFYVGEPSLVTIAPPGSGKTLCHAIPTLNHYRGPAIVLDIKGDCHAKSAAWREANVGPTLTFNPVNPEQSSQYNPLAFVSEDENLIWEDARLMADLLVTPSKSSDPTWERLGKDLLTLILAVVTMTEPLETRTMPKVLDYVATIGLSEMLETVAEADSPFPSSMRRTASRFHSMAANASKQFEGVLGGITQQLHLWEGSRIEKVTSASDWAPEDLRSAPYKTLYLNVPPDAISTYAPLLRVIIGQHVRRMMREMSDQEAPILFMLDELPQLGFMEPVRQALEAGRSYGIKLWMICQYREQMTDAYPGVGEGMIESCSVQLYMNPRHRTAEMISREFGMTKGLFDKERKPLLDPVEMTGPKYRDSIFVRVAGEDGMVLRKKFHAG